MKVTCRLLSPISFQDVWLEVTRGYHRYVTCLRDYYALCRTYCRVLLCFMPPSHLRYFLISCSYVSFRRGEMRWFVLMSCRAYKEALLVAFGWCACFPRCARHVPWNSLTLFCGWQRLMSCSFGVMKFRWAVTSRLSISFKRCQMYEFWL